MYNIIYTNREYKIWIASILLVGWNLNMGGIYMLRVVLVDDEKLSLNELSFILSKNSGVEIIGK